jgi:2-succinyl-6-hydroxy-2,4-cyclohexadiene-1-carboxylate synthase
LSQLACPTLLIVGEQDHKFQKIAEEMRSKSKKIEVQIVEGAGHNVHFEKPVEFAGVLKKFLK